MTKHDLPNAVGSRHLGCDRSWVECSRHWLVAERDETGAALILALVFVVVGALSLLGLVTFTGSALINSAQLQTQRNLEYAADGATDIAVQAVRYRPSAFTASPPQACLGAASVTLDGHPFSVYCHGYITDIPIGGTPTGSTTSGSTQVRTVALFSIGTTFIGYEISDVSGAIPTTPPTFVLSQTHANGTAILSASATETEAHDTFILNPTIQRTVTFYTCSAAEAPLCAASTAGAQSHAEVVATVGFSDVSATGSSACATTSAEKASTTCGTAMVVKKWVFRSATQ